MSDESKPATPDGLGDEGTALFESITNVWELNPAEIRLLTEAAFLVDELAAQRAALRDAGPLVPGSRGNLIANPAINALRDGRAMLKRLLAGIDLPDEDAVEPSIASQGARHAANERWRQVRELEAERRRLHG